MYFWQQDLWQRFCQQQQQQRLPHALLLLGVSGLGKQQFANAIVANVLCTSLQADHSPCGQCHSCQLLSAGNHPDHIEIMPEEQGKQIKIDQIRNLKDKQQLTSSVARWKTIIISPADSMNVNAGNSLLKLLEEPQHNTLLLLVTDKAEKLPITIRSRCQSYYFASPTRAHALMWLAEQGIDKQGSDIEKILGVANGAPLKALKMLNEGTSEQCQQLERDFNLMLSGQVNPITLAASWKEYNLNQVLHYLQSLVKERCIEPIYNQKTELNKKHYLKISYCIMHTIKLTSSSNNINNTLLTEDFIVSVINITHKARQEIWK